MKPIKRYDAIGIEVTVTKKCMAFGLRDKRGKIMDVDTHDRNSPGSWTNPVKALFKDVPLLMYFAWSDLKRWRPKK